MLSKKFFHGSHWEGQTDFDRLGICCCPPSALNSLFRDDMEGLNDRVPLERFVMVALGCIQEDPSLRPTMRGERSELAESA